MANGDGRRMDAPDWWKRAVFYHVYPRSFQDSNGDGIGDLQGIIERLDYLNDGTEASLGIDAIWLCPTFPSEMKDFGYDVTDYLGVHDDFGTLETLDRLVEECHARGIRVILDFVPNHSSDKHPWFQEALRGRDSPRRDWYYWRPPRDDGYLPNNWLSVFGGPAWTFHDQTGEYYLHSFLPEQPDLNWRNPEVVAAMHDVLRFWLRRGIDGFRIDVMGMVLKHPELLDNPPNPAYEPGMAEHTRLRPVNSLNYPDVFDAVHGIRRVLDEFSGSVTVGEVFGSPADISHYYGSEEEPGLHLNFIFRLIGVDADYLGWDAADIGAIVDAYDDLPPHAHPCYALNNHDRPRFISRHDADGRGYERARAACLLLLGLRSTPFIYYGEEIGMVDVDVPETRLQDPARFHHPGRDPERTPMQWDDSPRRGFSTGEPWLPVGPASINARAQRDDPDSMLSLYRRAIHLRRREPALYSGEYRRLPAGDDVFMFERSSPGSRPVICAINTAPVDRAVDLPASTWSVLLGTGAEVALTQDGRLHLPGLGGAWLARS